MAQRSRVWCILQRITQQLYIGKREGRGIYKRNEFVVQFMGVYQKEGRKKGVYTNELFFLCVQCMGVVYIPLCMTEFMIWCVVLEYMVLSVSLCRCTTEKFESRIGFSRGQVRGMVRGYTVPISIMAWRGVRFQNAVFPLGVFFQALSFIFSASWTCKRFRLQVILLFFLSFFGLFLMISIFLILRLEDVCALAYWGFCQRITSYAY